MSDRTHPIWAIMNLVVILGFVLLFSYLNASNFDETEWKMLLEVAISIGGWKGLEAYLQKNLNSKEEKKDE